MQDMAGGWQVRADNAGGQPPLPDMHAKSRYLQELDEQVRLKRMKAEQEKMRIRMEDEKKEKEIAEYNPWGKAGAGAPMRNSDGSLHGRRKGPFQDPDNPGETSSPMAQTSQPQPGYQPQDLFGGNNFLESLRNLTLGGGGGDSLLLSNGAAGPGARLGGLGLSGPSPMDLINAAAGLGGGEQNPNPSGTSQTPERSFLRGQKPINGLNPWEKDEMSRKQRLQNETQDVLRRQIAEKEAEKARQAELRRLEEEREQDRLRKEQEELKLRYERELEESRKKEEETKKENERQVAERAMKQKVEQERREQALLEAQKSAEADRMTKRNGMGLTAQSPVPEVTAMPPSQPFRSNSPPIPTLRKKSSGTDGFGNLTEQPPLPPADSFRSQNQNRGRPMSGGSPPIKGALSFGGESFMGDNERMPLGTQQAPQQQGEQADKQALLEQLFAIQRDLQQEQFKVKSELSSQSTKQQEKVSEKSGGKIIDFTILDGSLGGNDGGLSEKRKSRGGESSRSARGQRQKPPTNNTISENPSVSLEHRAPTTNPTVDTAPPPRPLRTQQDRPGPHLLEDILSKSEVYQSTDSLVGKRVRDAPMITVTSATDSVVSSRQTLIEKQRKILQEQEAELGRLRKSGVVRPQQQANEKRSHTVDFDEVQDKEGKRKGRSRGGVSSRPDSADISMLERFAFAPPNPGNVSKKDKR
ncbi:hypothetical protein HK102_002736 [Quaeritorhiza haematococci]|nr:hypothetical protein HK102_002736 [Quaeritorhiza haematococci]